MSYFARLALLVVLSLTPVAVQAKSALEPSGPMLVLSSLNAVQGGFLYGKTDPDVRVSLDGRAVSVSAEGQFFLAFHYNASAKSVLRLESAGGDVNSVPITVKVRQFNVERIDGLPPGKVTAPPQRQKRIAGESAKKRAARAQKGMSLDWLKGFIDPVETYRLSGFYGSQRILNGVPKRPHYGLDFAAPTGTPVKAPAGGVVTLAEDDFWYEGGLIFLDHGQGLQSAFLHLSGVTVKAGDVIKQGHVIGAVGAKGRATGPHLDWRVNWGKTWIDPQVLLASKPPQAITGGR